MKQENVFPQYSVILFGMEWLVFLLRTNLFRELFTSDIQYKNLCIFHFIKLVFPSKKPKNPWESPAVSLHVFVVEPHSAWSTQMQVCCAENMSKNELSKCNSLCNMLWANLAGQSLTQRGLWPRILWGEGCAKWALFRF